MTISAISIGNKSLNFLDERIKDIKYRGYHSSQHNRYTMEKVNTILSLLNKYAPNKSLMIIRTTDITKRPKNIPEEYTYAKFCDEAKELAGIGTQDAMRKNLFVDFHRMGLINRYNKEGVAVNSFSKQQIKYVSLTDEGIKLINSKNILDKYFIFSKAIDVLLGGSIDRIFGILRDEEYSIEDISSYEYMFFITAIGVESDFNLTTDEAVNMIKEFRKLTSIQRKSVTEFLKAELNPKGIEGSKIHKRDFGNWYNETGQVFSLLNQTIYFEVRGTKLVLKTGKDSITEVITKISRSLNEKYLYFVKHKTEKTKGFELHHVIPLSWAESVHHFKMLDVWKNMVYIDGFSHAKISQNKNRNVILTSEGNDIILTDPSKYEVYLKYQKNILYNPDNKEVIEGYNYELLNTLK